MIQRLARPSFNHGAGMLIRVRPLPLKSSILSWQELSLRRPVNKHRGDLDLAVTLFKKQVGM